MSIFGHLGELRRRIAIVGFLFLLALIGSFFIIREMADYLLIIGLRSGFSFVYLAPSELVSSYFKLSITTGLCVSLPLALYQLWCFITPALTASQRKSGYKALLGGLCLFILGVLFAYTVTLPAMLGFLVNFNTSEHINPSISVSEFLNFVLGVLLVFGLIFEMPMLAFMLSKFSILKPEYMIKTRMYAVLLIFIVAAIITPPDVLSQFMVAIPMIGLYNVSIWISRAVWRHKENTKVTEDEVTNLNTA